MNQVVSKVSKLSLLCFEKKKGGGQNGSVCVSFHQSDKVHCSSNLSLKIPVEIPKDNLVKILVAQSRVTSLQNSKQHTCIIK